MYCVNCGVRLEDTEKKCPLCNTVVYHPDIKQEVVTPLYPKGKIPKLKPKPKALNGAVIILFLIPTFISLLSDWQPDSAFNWSWFVVGALALGYIAVGLPFWFQKPNPVVFVPCNFAAITLYLLYINLATGGGWFLGFAFPIIGGLCLITCTVVTLLYYLQKGTLYIWGGAFIAIGAFMLLIEFLLDITFHINFIGWSIYPLIVLTLLGGVLIYLAINSSAREMMERKLFF